MASPSGRLVISAAGSRRLRSDLVRTTVHRPEEGVLEAPSPGLPALRLRQITDSRELSWDLPRDLHPSKCESFTPHEVVPVNSIQR
jgi:hypothetical protein